MVGDMVEKPRLRGEGGGAGGYRRPTSRSGPRHFVASPGLVGWAAGTWGGVVEEARTGARRSRSWPALAAFEKIASIALVGTRSATVILLRHHRRGI